MGTGKVKSRYKDRGEYAGELGGKAEWSTPHNKCLEKDRSWNMELSEGV